MLLWNKFQKSLNKKYQTKSHNELKQLKKKKISKSFKTSFSYFQVFVKIFVVSLKFKSTWVGKNLARVIVPSINGEKVKA